MTLLTFVSPTTGRNVTFNTSSVEPVLLKKVSMKGMRDLISEYERLRVHEFWDTVILLRSKKGKWLQGFDTSGRGLTHLKLPAAQQLAGKGLRAQALWNSLRKFPLHKQKTLLESIKPDSLEELKQISPHPNFALAPDLRRMLSEAGSPETFLARLCSHLRLGYEPLYHPPRYSEFLTMLWSKGLFLYPTKMRLWKSIKYKTFFNPVYSSKADLLSSVVSESMSRYSIPAFSSVCNAFASSNFQTGQDLSLELIDAFEGAFVSEIEEQFPKEENDEKWSSMRGSARTGMVWLRQCYNRENPEHAIVISRPPRRSRWTNQQRLAGDFKWFSALKPNLKPWAESFRKYIADSPSIRVRSPTEKLNFFADFLCLTQSPPTAPWELKREDIFSPTDPERLTFIKYLGDRFPGEDPKRKNDILGKCRNYFDWLKDQLLIQGHKAAQSFANPINRNDNFGARGRPSNTHRPRLDNYIINTMKEILLEDDFRFSKSNAMHQVPVVDNTTKKSATVWDPSMTVCMYGLLETPLRSHQMRWLDSGEFDQQVYDEVKHALVMNPSKLALKGRNEGALRLTSDSAGQDPWLSMWVNTNKSAQYDSRDIGYPYPYVSSQLQQLLIMQRSWQRRYLPPLLRLVPYTEYQNDTKERPRVAAKLQGIAPLFRDSRSADRNRPIAYSKLKVFYTSLLAEAQKRIEEKYDRKIQLVRMVGDKVRWAVDLHTLRVSGITALIEAGVPLEIVSRFVAGHRTLMMTIHYIKYAPSKLHARLKSAHEQMTNDMDFAGSPDFQANLDELAPYLLGQEGPGAGAGLIALREATGILSINTEGICPGTSCDNGGPLISKAQDSYGPVPGGQRCGLCRFWITGPAHLHGQVAAVNNLAYKIRKKGFEVAELNDKRLDAEDEGNQRKARALNDKVELLSRELAIDVNEWFARYRYAEQSMELMNDYLATKSKIVGRGEKVPVLTSATATELRVTLESAHEFELLNHITQMADFTTGFRNNEAELEKRSVLSTLMMENGVRPFLLQLTEEQAHEAGNLLSSMILHQVEGQDLDEVLNGHRPLSDYPALSKAINMMADQAKTSTDDAPFLSSKLTKVLNRMQSSQSGTSQEEETFA
ncbi:VPA1269 family protein [Paraburkholderia strydomiana]|uniref:VPA1269 family protein n=1 Tax=Paraburkholderia strydomiana TaxID=1245417 RepID=UPI0038BC21CA